MKRSNHSYRILQNLVIGLFLFLITSGSLWAASPGKMAQKILPNGMHLVAKENRSNKSVTFNCLVRTGSIHEDKYLGMGLSHYLEHLVSGGSTLLRTEDEYGELTKKIGAYVNAYTTYGHTAYHITVDKAFADEALKMISENLMLCSLYDKEIVREKDVILKEFVYRTTSPRDMISQRNMELVFRRSNLRFPIIGISDLFKRVAREDLLDYYKSRYCPNNMVFVACGDFDADQMLESLTATFQDYTSGKLFSPSLPEEPVVTGNRRYVEEFDNKLPLGYVTWIIPQTKYSDLFALDAAAEILFSKRNSPIRLKLIEETGLCTFIYGFLQDIDGVNNRMLRIIFDAKKPGDMDKIVATLDQEIAKVLKTGITSQQVDAAYSRYKAHHFLKTPSSEDEADEIARNLYSTGIADTFKLYSDEYERLTPDACTKAVAKYMTPTNRVVFFAVPKGEAQGLINQGKSSVTSSEITRKSLSNNVTLLHQFCDKAPLVKGTITLKNISLDMETKKTLGLLDFILEMMFRGSKSFPAKELDDWFEDHMVSISTAVGREEATISFRHLKEDTPRILEIITDAIRRPLFDDLELTLAKKRFDAGYRAQLGDPSEIHGQFRNAVLYKGSRDAATLEERNEIIQNISRGELEKLFTSLFKSQDIHVSLYGDLSLAEAEELARGIRQAIPMGIPNTPLEKLIIPKGPAEYENPYKFEAVNVNLNFPAPSCEDRDFIPMLAIKILLNGSNGRLHKATRGDRDLAYFAYCGYTYNKAAPFFRVVSQTSMAKKDDLRKTLEQETRRLSTEKVDSAELQSAVDEWYNKLKSIYTEEEYFGMLASYDSSGMGYDFPEQALTKLRLLTPDQICDAAARWLTDPVVIISHPRVEEKTGDSEVNPPASQTDKK